jgi:hypothetical protein
MHVRSQVRCGDACQSLCLQVAASTQRAAWTFKTVFESSCDRWSPPALDRVRPILSPVDALRVRGEGDGVKLASGSGSSEQPIVKVNWISGHWAAATACHSLRVAVRVAVRAPTALAPIGAVQAAAHIRCDAVADDRRPLDICSLVSFARCPSRDTTDRRSLASIPLLRTDRRLRPFVRWRRNGSSSGRRGGSSTGSSTLS